MRRSLKRIGMAVAAGALVAGTLFTAPPGRASEPDSEKITLQSTPGRYVYTWKGEAPISGATGLAAYQATGDPCLDKPEAGEDIHHIEFVFQHSRIYKEANILFIFSFTWEPEALNNDIEMSVYGPSGGAIGGSHSAENHEEWKTTGLDAGKYDVIACSQGNEVPQPYEGRLELVVTEKSSSRKTTATTVAPPQSGSGTPASPSGGATTPASPSGTSKPAVGAGRTSSITVPGPIQAALPANEIDAAPSAYIGPGAPPESLASGTPPPADIGPREKTASMPFWTAIVTSLLGIAGGAFALFVRRRQGLDVVPSTAVVPVS